MSFLPPNQQRRSTEGTIVVLAQSAKWVYPSNVTRRTKFKTLKSRLTNMIVLRCRAWFSYRPVVTLDHYNIIMYSLGGAHCFFSFLVLITYFLSNHPTLPSIGTIVQRAR